ncbi:MAG: TIGR03915 family putative DNA repair protein [Raoultibacter sp.]
MSGITYLYDGSSEGLLTAIFQAYAQREEPEDILRSECAQLRLDQEVFEVETDLQLAARVQRGIVRACGTALSNAVLVASRSDDCCAGSIIYRFVRYALTKNAHKSCAGCQRKIHCTGICAQSGGQEPLFDVSHDEVAGFYELNRAVYNERHRIMQFLRFEHLQGDVWFARCNPKASVVPLVMEWFVGRFNTQNFMIYDEVHKLAGVYEGAAADCAQSPVALLDLLSDEVDKNSCASRLAQGSSTAQSLPPENDSSWYLVKTDALQVPEPSAEEEGMQAAWKVFYDHVAVGARYNPELRQQFMPQRLWKNITEMKPAIP